MTSSLPHTVGVAIPVPEPFSSLLREARASFGDPLAATVPTHITLTPPLQLDGPARAEIPELLAEVATQVPAYRIALNGTGTFRPVSPVVFVAIVDGVEPTEHLAREVRAVAGVHELEFEYRPHITVAHHLDDASLDRAEAELAAFVCEFVVTEFALYDHHDERGWEPHHSFALAGPVD